MKSMLMRNRFNESTLASCLSSIFIAILPCIIQFNVSFNKLFPSFVLLLQLCSSKYFPLTQPSYTDLGQCQCYKVFSIFNLTQKTWVDFVVKVVSCHFMTVFDDEYLLIGDHQFYILSSSLSVTQYVCSLLNLSK